MGSLRLIAIDDICQRGSIRDADVTMLRRAFEREPHLTPSDIEALARIHSMARIQDPSWADFFVQTMTDYIVREQEPSGYVTATQAGWLIARISSGGRVRTKTVFELLVNVVDKARWVPESLMAYALGQIREAVATGAGALRTSQLIAAGVITLAEIEHVRRLLFAYGADRPSPITQIEADLLIDIDAAICAADTRMFEAEIEGWTDLFCKALANAVLAASDYWGPSRVEALRESSQLLRIGRVREAGGVGRLPVFAAVGGVLKSYRQSSVEARALATLERQRIEIITGEPVGQVDAARLAKRLLDPAAGARVLAIVEELQAAGAVLAPAFGARNGAVERAA